MDSHLDNSILEILKRQEGKGGFNLNSLADGTKLTIKTNNSVYELVVGPQTTIFGGTRTDGTVRFPTPTPVDIHGSTWGGSMIKLDWIGEGMCLEFYDPKTDMTTTTSYVKNVIVEGPNDGWSYDLEWTKA